MSVSAESMRSSSLSTVSQNRNEMKKSLQREKESKKLSNRNCLQLSVSGGKVFSSVRMLLQGKLQAHFLFVDVLLLVLVEVCSDGPVRAFLYRHRHAGSAALWLARPAPRVTTMPGRGDCKQACRQESAPEEAPQQRPVSEMEEPTSFTAFCARRGWISGGYIRKRWDSSVRSNQCSQFIHPCCYMVTKPQKKPYCLFELI